MEVTTRKPDLTSPRTEAPHWTNEVSFNGNGYLHIKPKLLDYQKGEQIEIKIELSTIERDGLLLWQGKNDNSIKHYIALGIVDGEVNGIQLLANFS